MERPTLRQLEILAEVARVGTFRGAARHLGLSQVAVSDHIKQLETRLGCALFVRTVGGKPRLSASGQIVLDHGRNVLFACDALIGAAREAAEKQGEAPAVVPARKPAKPRKAAVPEPPPAPESAAPLVEAEPAREEIGDAEDAETAPLSPQPEPFGVFTPAPFAAEPAPVEIAPETVRENPITVASHPAILSRFQDKLAAAQEAFPDRPIAVDFARFTPDAVVPLLRSGKADIALFYALDDVPGLPSDYLWSERWSLFARDDHPLAEKDAVGFADCADMLVILFDDGNPLRALCEACLARAGLWPTPTVLETDDFSAIAAELDYGEAVFPAFGVTAAQFAARPGIKRIALVEALPAVQVRRAVASEAQDDPTIAALAGLLG